MSGLSSGRGADDAKRLAQRRERTDLRPDLVRVPAESLERRVPGADSSASTIRRYTGCRSTAASAVFCPASRPQPAASGATPAARDGPVAELCGVRPSVAPRSGADNVTATMASSILDSGRRYAVAGTEMPRRGSCVVGRYARYKNVSTHIAGRATEIHPAQRSREVEARSSAKSPAGSAIARSWPSRTRSHRSATRVAEFLQRIRRAAPRASMMRKVRPEEIR